MQAKVVLSGSAHRFGKGGGVGFAAVGAAATFCPVLGDFQGDGRKVKDLSCFKVIVMSGCTERLAAVEARSVGGEVMMNNVIRVGDFLKGGTGMAFRPPGLRPDFLRKLLSWGVLVKLLLSVEEGLLLVRLLRSSSAMRISSYSRASIRSNHWGTKSAMASGTALAMVVIFPEPAVPQFFLPSEKN